MSVNIDKRYPKSKLDTNQKQLTENDKRLYYTASTGSPLFLLVHNQNVIITNDAMCTVVLPSVAKAKNLSFTVKVVNDGNAVTLTDAFSGNFSDSVDWGGDYTLDAAGDYITLKSNGKSWTVVDNGIS